ncbi:MAG: hypothetical protein LBG45_01965 [Dysgonamonadaceae bacterium]|jgi:hypothetical protein|nr:hypothetical protein [Dysgonamonadaceae bacterium]
MSTVKIFVEGIADEKFLLDYIEHILPESAIKNYTIINAEGWGINKKTQQIMQRNTDEGGVNLVVFDADIDFEDKKKEIEKWKTDFHLSFELFLFPNNRDNGTLENLLEEIIPEKNRPISDCWEGYEKCLKSKTIEGREKPLTTPAKKTKIYGYLEALLGDSKREKVKIKEKERDYGNIDHWDLGAAYLNPLKEFLVQQLRTR